MSILPITVCGDKILRKKAAKVLKVDDKIIKLIDDMFETMHNANGIGLAANQVGANRRIFVIDISKVEDYEDVKPLALINPKIIEKSKETVSYEEGCLSIPDQREDVIRPQRITIEFQDKDLNTHTIEADDLLARVMQHEYDHLLGILFTDLVDEETKKRLKKPLNKIKKRKIEVDYPISQSEEYRIM
ncbi:MAG: peptide deformylase [Ignavibacteriales bacterium]|nr:peptide deformylase [Ignavibacteriales bacterium]